MSFARNVLGQPLETCSCDPMTGFYRTGDCFTGEQDRGLHVICAEMTADFLRHSMAQGNDLSTPRPEYNFPGLQPGDHWCVCATRWVDAARAGCAPPVNLAATHEAALRAAPLSLLKAHAWGSEKES